MGDRVGADVEPVPVSVGVIAYNEEANIGQILDALLRQRAARVRIAEIVVVSSGSTDRTDQIVREVGARAPLVRLIAEPQREGKASAVNTFLAAASSDLLVLASADIVPDGDAVEQLCLPFEDPTIGITGARPVPTNRTDTFAGVHAHVLYALRHEISLEALKTGELLAFRRVVPFLPSHSSVDEDWIHIAVERAGYRGQYVPTARCYNHGPETVREIVRQRVRLVAGELALVGEYGWACPTMKRTRVLRLLLKQLRTHRPRSWPRVLAVAPLEVYIRLRAWRLLLTRGEDFRWEPATTSKRVALDRLPLDARPVPPSPDPTPTLAGSPD